MYKIIQTILGSSKAPTAPTEEESPIKKAIAAFALENSCEVPDSQEED